MATNNRPLRRWLIATVLLHLLVSISHGAAHAQAHVPLSTAANLFVGVVVVAGPLVGLGLMRRAETVGAGLTAITLTGSLVFGLINHFVLVSPDHVGRVSPQWRSLFTATAVLLVLTEALGSGLAIRLVSERKRVS